MLARCVSLVALALLVAAAWMLLLPEAPVAQPIAFSHGGHAALACTVCHKGADRAIGAGIPSGTVCAGCHATVPPGAAESPAWNALLANGDVRWHRVARLPDHTVFSHRRHVALAGLDCASCHADIGRRSASPPRPPVRLDMSGCVSCHRREGASEDCAACHR
jgi:hypothetical protein